MGWFTQIPKEWRWCLMMKIRSAMSWFKPNPVLILWAALLLPWVEGIAVPLRPHPDEITS
jgi:hypothetical protein